MAFRFLQRERCFALDNDFNLDIEKIKKFIEKNKNKTIFIFGFTSFIWQNFLMELEKNNEIIKP